MKNKAKILLATLAAAIPVSVFGANITLKKFDVSGTELKVGGAVSSEGEQISLLIKSDGGYEWICQEVSGPGGNFDFAVSSPEGWNKKYTAILNGDESDGLSVEFNGDGSYASYKEPETENAVKGETVMDGVAYGNRVVINGCLDKTKVYDKNVTVVVYKKTAAADPAAEDILYIGQTVAAADGNFAFDFSILDDINFCKVACFAGGENITKCITTAKTGSEYIIANVALDKITENGIDMAQMTAAVENSGNEGVEYTLIITVYDRNGLLIDMKKSESKIIGAGESISDTLTLQNLPSDAATVKAMLWSMGETTVPLDTVTTINIGG